MGDDILNRQPPATARVWFGLAAGAAAWVLQGVLGTAIASRTCDAAEAHMSVPGMLRMGLLVLSALAFVLAVSAALTAFARWRHLARSSWLQAEGYDGPEFLSFAGVLVSSVFALEILWAALPAFFVGGCGAGR